MEWFALSSKYYIDLDDEGVSEKAQTLLTRICGYIADNETSGYIAKSALKKLGLSSVSRRTDELIRNRIIVETADGLGYDVPAWFKWNEALERLVRKRKADRDRIAEKRRHSQNVARQSQNVAEPHKQLHKEITEVVEVSHVSSAREIEPPPPNLDLGPRCDQHLADPNPPACRGCADARRAVEESQRQAAVTAQRLKSSEARRRAELIQEAVDECDMCDERGYFGTTVCNHDPNIVETAQRGMALVRSVLAQSAQERS
ncbi:hypothetical protein ABH922_002767 [Rhodococcus sp. 27YEA15]|uniref:hypothetical protein n=1 Tax=Rhodococcus sp. 27YEA15 TaxID=3156259 RepID=UPI003C7B2CB5